MSTSAAEESKLHTRLLKCALEVEEARAYWAHAVSAPAATAQQAFSEYWFGAKSLARVDVLLVNMRARFDAFPGTLPTLARWVDMPPETRRVICHWHLQLSDPLYRAFTGEFLVERRTSDRPHVTRDVVVRWVAQQGPGRWTLATHIQFASKLLSAAFAAGLVETNRDPRPLTIPYVPDEAIEYFLYVLRSVDVQGTLVRNPYFASVGLDEGVLDGRLRNLASVSFRRQGQLTDIAWAVPDLAAWSDTHLRPSAGRLAEIRR